MRYHDYSSMNPARGSQDFSIGGIHQYSFEENPYFHTAYDLAKKRGMIKVNSNNENEYLFVAANEGIKE